MIQKRFDIHWCIYWKKKYFIKKSSYEKINGNKCKTLMIDRTGKLYSANDKHLVFLLAPYALQQTIMNKQPSCRSIFCMYSI